MLQQITQNLTHYAGVSHMHADAERKLFICGGRSRKVSSRICFAWHAQIPHCSVTPRHSFKSLIRSAPS